MQPSGHVSVHLYVFILHRGMVDVRAEHVAEARRAYLATRQRRAQMVCGHLPGGMADHTYHPERCSRKRRNGNVGRREPRRRREVQEYEREIQSLQRAIAVTGREAQEITLRQDDLPDDARPDAAHVALAYAFKRVITMLPGFITEATSRMLDIDMVRDYRDVRRRYRRIAELYDEDGTFLNDVVAEHAVYCLVLQVLGN